MDQTTLHDLSCSFWMFSFLLAIPPPAELLTWGDNMHKVYVKVKKTEESNKISKKKKREAPWKAADATTSSHLVNVQPYTPLNVLLSNYRGTVSPCSMFKSVLMLLNMTKSKMERKQIGVAKHSFGWLIRQLGYPSRVISVFLKMPSQCNLSVSIDFSLRGL